MDTDRVERIVVEVPSVLRYGEALRAMVSAMSQRLELETETPELQAHVVSAFNEAYNNVIDHAYGGSPASVIGVEIVLSTASVSISITDRGPGFDIDAIEAPDMEILPERGLGLLIIRSVMSSVRYERHDGRNVLTMTKSFARPLALGASAHGSREREE